MARTVWLKRNGDWEKMYLLFKPQKRNRSSSSILSNDTAYLLKAHLHLFPLEVYPGSQIGGMNQEYYWIPRLRDTREAKEEKYKNIFDNILSAHIIYLSRRVLQFKLGRQNISFCVHLMSL